MISKLSKIYVAGHQGLVGSAIWKNLQGKGYTNLIGRNSQGTGLDGWDRSIPFFRRRKA